MNGVAASGAHVGVGLARQDLGDLGAERDEGLWHLLAGAAADIEYAAGCE